MQNVGLILAMEKKALTYKVFYGYFDGLMQERCNSIANALGLPLSCINSSILKDLFSDVLTLS